MGKDREGKFHPRKGKPSAKAEAITSLKNVNSNTLDDHLEIADKYTVGEEEPAPNVHVRHPNRNVDKNEERKQDKKDNNDDTNKRYKSKTETYTVERVNTVAEQLPTIPAKDQLTLLVNYQAEVCISVYMPTHASGVEKNEQMDTIAFKSVLQQITSYLRQKNTSDTVIERLLKPGYDLVRDDNFWLNMSHGLGVFIADGHFKFIKMPYAPKQEILINTSFYISPLIPVVTQKEYFYILVLSKKQAKFYKADAFGITHIPVPEMPDGVDDVVHFENKDDQKLWRTDTSGAGHGANFHGIGSGKPDEKANLAMYFDEVDETLWKEILHNENAPLLLAGVEYLIPIYRSVAEYKHIWDDALTGSHEHLDINSLYQQARKKMDRYFAQRASKALENYGNQSATGLTSSIPADVIPAAHYGRVSNLFVLKDAHLWGKFDEQNNELTIHDAKQDGDECLIDRAVIKTLLTGGDVHPITEQQRMPGGSRIAALMRY